MIDRLPPQSLEAEQSVLGAILIDRDAVIEVAEFLRPEDFYRQANGRIYAAILDLFERREPIDIVTVAEALERREDLEAIGGRAYLSSLSNETPTAVHAAQYARIVERKAVLRNLIGAAGRIAGIGYEDPAEIQEAIDRAEAELFSVSQKRIDAGFSPLKALLHDAYDRLDYLHAHRGEISGVRTGFTDLDALTTGLQPSDDRRRGPTVLGKTSFALNIAEHAAVKEGRSVGVFSLEMSKEQLVLRLLSSVANIDSQRLRTGFLEELDFARIAPAMNSSRKRRSTSTTRRTSPRWSCGPRPAGSRRRPDWTLSWSTTCSSCRRRPRPRTPTASRRSRRLTRSQGPGARAIGAGRRPVAALATARDARVEGAAALGPAGVGRDRAGRRPRAVPLAREGTRQGRPGLDGEVINLKLAKHRNGPTGEIQLWFKKRQTRFVSYAGERFAEVS